MNREALEHWALQLMSNGAGDHPLPDREFADTVHVSWPLEHPDRPYVAFRKNGATTAFVEFTMRVVPTAEQTDYTDALKEIAAVEVPEPSKQGRAVKLRRRRIAQNFYLGLMGIRQELDPDEKKKALQAAFNKMVESNEITLQELKTLKYFFRDFFKNDKEVRE